MMHKEQKCGDRVMNLPIHISWQQIILFISAVIGLRLLILFIVRIFSKKKDIEEREDKKWRRYRLFRWLRGIIGIVLLVFGVFFLEMTLVPQDYLELTGHVLVAHVRATQVKDAGSVPQMRVDLILYDQNGNKTSDKVYVLGGDKVFIQGDMLEFPEWMNILGIHSGYKLTALEGRYSDPNLEKHALHTVEILNGGADPFFESAYSKGWASLFVTAARKNGSAVPANGAGYNICASQNAVVSRPDNESC
jgi:amino acid transporter